MVIGIVDDETTWANRIADYIKSYFLLIDNNDYELHLYKSGEELKSDLDLIDLLFLDVELSGGEDGFTVAEYIQEKEYGCKICFLTSHIEFARHGYRLNAYRYIDKLHLDEIDEALASYISNVAKAEYIDCKTSDGVEVKLNVAESLYLEIRDRRICYHMSDGKEYFGDGNLKDLACRFEKNGLILVQRSYVVNMKYVRCSDSREVTIIDGTKITISRDRLQEFKRKFFEWRRNSIG